jgi:ferredoxin
MNIAPGKCISCRLCESTCPFGAIDGPVETPSRPSPIARRRTVMLMLALPVIVGVAALLGTGLGFGLAGTLVCGFIGLAVGGRLIRLSMARPRDEYNANRAACYSCMRCVPACPKQPAMESDDAVFPLPIYPSAEVES